jgi:hypothetical protein
VTPRLAEVVYRNELRDAVRLSLVAGLGLTSAYAFLLLGFVRAREPYQHGELAPATLYGVIGVASLAITVSGIIVGLIFLRQGGIDVPGPTRTTPQHFGHLLVTAPALPSVIRPR